MSHWTGGLPVLEITTDRYNQGLDHLFGTFKYAGKGVYGFASTSAGVPKDSFGRNIYVDTFDSAYGSGWKRENSFLTHATNGSFCYLFAKHGEHPNGDGEKYRATVIGPGVTPDEMWSGKPAGTSAEGPGRCGRRDQGDERPRLQAGLTPGSAVCPRGQAFLTWRRCRCSSPSAGREPGSADVRRQRRLTCIRPATTRRDGPCTSRSVG